MTRRLGLGGLASVLALAGVVAFATEASAHDNVFQSVTATCNAPGAGSGATLTWTLYNNWNLSETGTYSTSQGTLSTNALSIGASPTENAVPPQAASQQFTQTLTDAQLAGASTITVDWTATWSDTTHVSGTLSTAVADLNLPNGCVPTTTAPTVATTLVPPADTSVGNVWGDSATVTGVPGGGAPPGSVSFTVCEVAAGDSTCTSGGTPVGSVDSPSSTDGDTSTYNLDATYTPSNVGTYCFYSVYTPADVDNYTTASGPAECFKVTPADPQFGTQQSGSTTGSGSVALGNSVSDVASVIGNAVGGAPTGSVTFFQCSTGAAAAVCPSGTQVGSPVTLTGSGDTSTATSAAFTPTATGTYCFAAVYTPDANSNYVGSDDNMTGTVAPTECFNVTAVATAAATTASTPSTPSATVASAAKTTTPAIAFTGAQLSQEWMIGLTALLLGIGLVLGAHWRRRTPRHAASKR